MIVLRMQSLTNQQGLAGNTALGIVGLDARVALNPFVMLKELGRDTVGQVGRYMIECSRFEIPDPHEDLKIRNRQAVGREVLAAMCFEPLLEPGEMGA